MRVPSAGRRPRCSPRRWRAPSPCPPCPRPAAAGPARSARRRARRRRLPRARRPAAARGSTRCGTRGWRYEPGPGATDTRGQRRPAARARRRRAARATRAGARGRPRPLGRALPRLPGGLDRAPAARRRPAGPGAGWVAGPGAPHRHPVFDVEVDRGLVAGLPRARRARGSTRDGRADPRPDPRGRDERGLALTRRCGSTRSTGTPRSLAADATVNGAQRGARRRAPCGTWRASSPARRRRARPATSGRAALPLPARARPAHALERRLGRVREHRARLLALLRRRRAARACARRRSSAAARLGPARARRLLDARRLPELGHRTGLLALAPAQEGRPRAAAR